LSPLGNVGQVEVSSPLGGGVGILGGVVSVGAHLVKIGVGGSHRLHHGTNGRRASDSVGRVDDTEHALGAMVGNGTVEEDRVGIVDDLLEGEILHLNARGEGRIRSLVARSELRALGNGVVVSAPDELDSVADGSVDGEGDVTKDTLSRSNPDDVGLAGPGWGSRGWGLRGRSQSRVLGLTLLNAVVVGTASPGVASRTIGGRRLGLINGGSGSVLGRRGVGGRVLGRRSVGGGVLGRRGVGGGVLRGGAVGGRVVVGRGTLVLAITSGEGWRGTPGGRRQGLICVCILRIQISRDHAIAVPGMFDQNGEWRSMGRLYMLTTRRYQTSRYHLERRPRLHCQWRNPREAAGRRRWTSKERRRSRRRRSGPFARFERTKDCGCQKACVSNKRVKSVFLSEGDLEDMLEAKGGDRLRLTLGTKEGGGRKSIRLEKGRKKRRGEENGKGRRRARTGNTWAATHGFIRGECSP